MLLLEEMFVRKETIKTLQTLSYFRIISVNGYLMLAKTLFSAQTVESNIFSIM